MRQPTSPLHALVAAVPADRLRELVLELLNGSIAPKPAPATPVRRRAAKRRRGWPLGKPRRRSQSRAGRRGSTRASGPDGSPEKRVGRRRKVPAKASHEGQPPKARATQAIATHPEKTNRAIAAEIGVSVQTVWRARAGAKAVAMNGRRRAKHTTAKPAARAKSRGPGRPRKAIGPDIDAKILAKRKREAQRLRVKRAAAKQNKAAKAAKAAKAVSNGTNGSAADASATATPTQRFWSHAEALQPTAPYKAVVREFGTNLALAKDSYRRAVLPPGMAPAAVERFLELAPPRAEAPPMAPHA